MTVAHETDCACEQAPCTFPDCAKGERMTGPELRPIARIDATKSEHRRQANELVRRKQRLHMEAAQLLRTTEDETAKEILLNVFDADRVMA